MSNEKDKQKKKLQKPALPKKFKKRLDDLVANSVITKSEHKIIHGAAITAMTIAASPIPMTDATLLTPLQIHMITRLYKANGFTITEGIVEGATQSAMVGGAGKLVAGNIAKSIPGLGTAAGIAINATIAVAFTEFLGISVARYLHESENPDATELAPILSTIVSDFFTQYTSKPGEIRRKVRRVKASK